MSALSSFTLYIIALLCFGFSFEQTLEQRMSSVIDKVVFYTEVPYILPNH